MQFKCFIKVTKRSRAGDTFRGENGFFTNERLLDDADDSLVVATCSANRSSYR